MNILIYNEGLHDLEPEVAAIYPNGIHGAIAAALAAPEHTITITTLADIEQKITPETLKQTDVLLWWGHMGHNKVTDAIAETVHQAVLAGMGFIALHSAHFSKPFRRIMGSSGTLNWYEYCRERLWVVAPAHPIAAGLPAYIDIPLEEVYREPFDIPKPDDLIFIGWFEGGEVFRSGCTYTRGYGKIFYFQPGHETCPIYHDPNIAQILRNAVQWARPTARRDEIDCYYLKSPEL